VWRSNGLKLHLSRTFKLSRDPRFDDRLLDVVSLYMNPPEHALVLNCDEKSQIQALDRTQPGLPIQHAGRQRDLDVPSPSSGPSARPTSWPRSRVPRPRSLPPWDKCRIKRHSGLELGHRIK